MSHKDALKKVRIARDAMVLSSSVFTNVTEKFKTFQK